MSQSHNEPLVTGSADRSLIDRCFAVSIRDKSSSGKGHGHLGTGSQGHLGTGYGHLGTGHGHLDTGHGHLGKGVTGPPGHWAQPAGHWARPPGHRAWLPGHRVAPGHPPAAPSSDAPGRAAGTAAASPRFCTARFDPQDPTIRVMSEITQKFPKLHTGTHLTPKPKYKTLSRHNVEDINQPLARTLLPSAR